MFAIAKIPATPQNHAAKLCRRLGLTTAIAFASLAGIAIQAPSAQAQEGVYRLDPGYDLYGGRPGLSWSSSMHIGGYAPIDAYGLSGDPGPNYVLPPEQTMPTIVNESVVPLYYDGYGVSTYPQNIGYNPTIVRDGYAVSDSIEERVYRPTYRHYSWRRPWHHHYRHHYHYGAIAAPVPVTVAYVHDRDDLPVASRARQTCIYNDYGGRNCRSSIY